MILRVRRGGPSSPQQARNRRWRSSWKKRVLRYLLPAALMGGIAILVVIQLTTLTNHPLLLDEHDQKVDSLRHAGPVGQALREQKRTLDRHLRDSNAPPSSARRRLNSTHNKSEAIVTADSASAEKNHDEGGLPLAPKTPNAPASRHVIIRHGEGHAHEKAPPPLPDHPDREPRRVEVRKVEDSNQTAEQQQQALLLGNQLNGTSQNWTEDSAFNRTDALSREEKKNRTNALIREARKKLHRPFRLKRSIPDAPSDFINRTMPRDPLRDLTFDISALKPLNYTLRSKWHGVLLDAGRHYFEVDWIYRMLDVLAVLQYNCLHFRLTDDQAWNVRLKSHPDLAHPVGIMGHDQVYTPEELRDIVAYGKTKGITVWPEINVPGHGGGWAGIPGLIVQCPEFICDKGYGVPINITHSKFNGILKDILEEIIDIFDHPPYLHLGGDEVDMAKPCFEELGLPMFNYDSFEKDLKEILAGIGYPEEQVIRWEMTGQRLNSPRTGKMIQHWFRIPGESAPSLGHNNFLASGGLYFDFNEMDMAWQVYLFTRRYYHLPKDNFPIGIIPGTFELNADFWYDRNVVGRLLAVTMGASEEVVADTGDELYSMYRKVCQEVGFDDALCSHYGLPFISWKSYKDKWTNVWSLWKNRICDRLTFPVLDTVFVKPGQHVPGKKEVSYHAQRRRTTLAKPETTFWQSFGVKNNSTVLDLLALQFSALEHKSNLTALTKRLVPKAGIVIDLTLDLFSSIDTLDLDQNLLSQMKSLGLNLVQLRLASTTSFGYLSTAVPQATWMDPKSRPTMEMLKANLVRKAAQLASSGYPLAPTAEICALTHLVSFQGIGIIPEISLSTHAGGLYEIDMNVECPRYMRATGHGFQNVSIPGFTAFAYALVKEVEGLATSGVIHLGSDERASAAQCLLEVGEELDFEEYEKKLSHLLEFDGISSDRIVRWSNEEGTVYPGRLGSITQCRRGDCRQDSTSEWMATVDLENGGAYDIYNAARELALRHPSSIIGEIGKIDGRSIGKNQIHQRMLAFTMGISDLTEWSRGMFEEKFILFCIELYGHEAGCLEFATSDKGVGDAAHRLEKNRKLVEDERTMDITRHVYRPEFQEQATVEIAAT